MVTTVGWRKVHNYKFRHFYSWPDEIKWWKETTWNNLGVNWEDNIKVYLKRNNYIWNLFIRLRKGQVAGPCEHITEPVTSIQCRIFLDLLRNYYLTDSAPWSWFFRTHELCNCMSITKAYASNVWNSYSKWGSVLWVTWYNSIVFTHCKCFLQNVIQSECCGFCAQYYITMTSKGMCLVHTNKINFITKMTEWILIKFVLQVWKS